MDNEKLEPLRRKYADAKGGDIFDPEFAAVARRMFSNTERRKWPLSDPATLLSAPFRLDVAAQPDFNLEQCHVDAVDPGFAPGTGAPEVGGLTPREALGILRGLAGLDVVGGDVAEFAPQYDATTNTAQIGAQALFELLCLVAIAHEQRTPSERR